MAPPAAPSPPLNLHTVIMAIIATKDVAGAPFLTHRQALVLDSSLKFATSLDILHELPPQV